MVNKFSYLQIYFKFYIIILLILAKNPELDRLHEAASRRLEELKLNKQTLTGVKKTNKKSLKKREKVEVIMEEDDQQVQVSNKTELVAEEN